MSLRKRQWGMRILLGAAVVGACLGLMAGDHANLGPYEEKVMVHGVAMYASAPGQLGAMLPVLFAVDQEQGPAVAKGEKLRCDAVARVHHLTNTQAVTEMSLKCGERVFVVIGPMMTGEGR